MRTFLRAALALVAVAPLAACGGSESLSRAIGLTRDAPDEFVVTTRAPLSMPPSYNLRPPQPGVQRPQELTPTQAAEAALVPQAVLGSGQQASLSPGQAALLDAAGPPAPSNIRANVNQEAAKEAHNQSLTDSIMFWKSFPPPGTVIDPAAEAKRLRENAALGQDMRTGDTPIIQKPKNGLIPSLF